jgi:RNA polymerase sigma-70 factor (ECF subfamily)
MVVIPLAQPLELEEERRAVARAQAGDPRALERVLARHAEPLFSSVLLPRLGDRAAAEDLVKETFVTALEKIGGFTWQGRSLFFWLRQIALNKLIDLSRQRGRAQRLLQALAAELTVSAPAQAADEALIAEEDRRRALERIDETLARLPERYAVAIRLRIMEERSRQECAATLQVEVGNFDVILFRALRAFRKEYGEAND